MNRRAIWALARKDMRAITSNMQVWLPMLILPLLLGVLLPGGIVIALSLFGLESAGDLAEFTRWLDRCPCANIVLI